MNAGDAARQRHITKRTTDTLRSANTAVTLLLPSARDLFAGETSPIRLGCAASVSALESGSESKENGSRERGRGEKVPFYLLPIPLFFSIQFFNLLFFGPLVQLMT